MNIKKKNKQLTRAEATELYRDLQKTMTQMKIQPKNSPGASKSPQAAPAQRIETRDEEYRPGLGALFGLRRGVGATGASGHNLAIGMVLLFAGVKVALSALEYSGFAAVSAAEASLATRPSSASMSAQTSMPYSKEELLILTSLDKRRADLEERNQKLDEREADLEKRDREYALRLTEVRELTEKLKVDFEKNEKKRNGQLEQLANVYG